MQKFRLWDTIDNKMYEWDETREIIRKECGSFWLDLFGENKRGRELIYHPEFEADLARRAAIFQDSLKV